MGRKPVAPPQLGEPFGIRRVFTKRFPLGQFSQSVAQAAMESLSFFKNPDDIAEINIQISRSAIKIMADGPDKWRPKTRETADHSIPYSAGLVLFVGYSLYAGVLALAVTGVLGYCIAYFLVMKVRSPAWRTVLFLAFIVPFWTSTLIRAIAWVPFLGVNGVINGPIGVARS